MAQISKQELKNKFKTGMYPSEQDFSNVFDSYVHKDDMVDVSQIKQTVEGINTSLPDMLNNVKSEAIDAANDYTDTALETAKDYTDTALEAKVDKETGKGLSTEDYTTAEKTKLANIETGAQVNVQADWNQTDTTADDYIKNKPTDIDISTKMDKSNPSGTGSFSMNRKDNTTIGGYSHAEGAYTEASGDYSHSEGYETKAVSHYQHVQGRFNTEDNQGIYADIVGNGTTLGRSNAYTLDWNGNGWFMGKISSDTLKNNSNTIIYSNNNGELIKSSITNSMLAGLFDSQEDNEFIDITSQVTCYYGVTLVKCYRRRFWNTIQIEGVYTGNPTTETTLLIDNLPAKYQPLFPNSDIGFGYNENGILIARIYIYNKINFDETNWTSGTLIRVRITYPLF